MARQKKRSASNGFVHSDSGIGLVGLLEHSKRHLSRVVERVLKDVCSFQVNVRKVAV